MSVKIYNDNVKDIKNTFLKNNLKKEEGINKPSPQAPTEDKVELSSNALNLKQMQQKVMSAPDIRDQKVSQIKSSINDGSYKISTDRIADKFIEEGLLDKEI